jgi:lycopene beta-cyclase
LDLYSFLREIERYHHIDRLTEKIDSISHDGIGPFILAQGGMIRGRTIFDSRTPVFKKTTAFQKHLYQSFIGWEIETVIEISENASFRLMDFNVPQNGFTQFMYVLPFSKHNALIEVTRFGDEPIEKKLAETILEEYATRHYGKFKIISNEVGCIPMSTFDIEQNDGHGIISIGAKGGQIKPSTGYAFNNMYEQSLVFADRIENGTIHQDIPKKNTRERPKRFAFYDAILLNILGSNPEKGKSIFLSLFQKSDTNLVLKFLDEKTSVWEELTLFSKLPLLLFLTNAFKLFYHTPSFRPFMLMITCISLLSLGNHTFSQDFVGYGLLLIGFVTVGIPHGAIDHLIESRNWELKGIARFSVNYISKALLMLLAWIVFPPLALLFFLLFSSWHFGQTDGKNWQFPNLTSFLWGSSVLTYILGTHVSETTAILSTIGISFFDVELPTWTLLPWFLFAFVTRRTPLILTLTWLTLSSQLPLIFAFGIYFIGQHSLSSWSHSSEYLNQSNKRMWIHALPFHLGAWALLVISLLVNAFMIHTTESQLWGIFFIFIACISFPHAIWMHKLYMRNTN